MADADDYEVVPLTTQDWADIAEGWSSWLGAGGFETWSAEERKRRAGVWSSTIGPILERHGFDASALQMVRVADEPREFVIKGRRK